FINLSSFDVAAKACYVIFNPANDGGVRLGFQPRTRFIPKMAGVVAFLAGINAPSEVPRYSFLNRFEVSVARNEVARQATRRVIVKSLRHGSSEPIGALLHVLVHPGP